MNGKQEIVHGEKYEKWDSEATHTKDRGHKAAEYPGSGRVSISAGARSSTSDNGMA